MGGVAEPSDGMVTWMEDVMGLPLADFVRSNPHLADEVRSRMLEGIAQVCGAPPPRPVDHWAVSERFQGIERAGLVVVNVRDPAERPAAEQLLVDLARLRKDDALFNDIVGWRGYRVPITAVVANLADPRDGGRKRPSPGCAEQYARKFSHFASDDEELLCIGVVGRHTGVRM
jgi:hypothetical protein